MRRLSAGAGSVAYLILLFLRWHTVLEAACSCGSGTYKNLLLQAISTRSRPFSSRFCSSYFPSSACCGCSCGCAVVVAGCAATTVEMGSQGSGMSAEAGPLVQALLLPSSADASVCTNGQALRGPGCAPVSICTQQLGLGFHG